jgi:inosose dehydratase
MSIRLGANPIIWSNDMRELGAETPLETCLAEARQIGFEGMGLGHKFPRDPVELAGLRPHLDLLKAVGSPVLVFADVSGAIHGNKASLGYNNLRRLLSENAR